MPKSAFYQIERLKEELAVSRLSNANKAHELAAQAEQIERLKVANDNLKVACRNAVIETEQCKEVIANLRVEAGAIVSAVKLSGRTSIDLPRIGEALAGSLQAAIASLVVRSRET